MNTELQTLIKSNMEDILKGIGVKPSITISETEVDYMPEKLISVELKGDNLGFLIGYHGEILQALQHILSLMVHKQQGTWVELVVDVNNYRREREEKLMEIVKNSIDKVRFFQNPVSLPPMPASERKFIHSQVSNYADVTTESDGEGYNRHIVIKPKA